LHGWFVIGGSVNTIGTESDAMSPRSRRACLSLLTAGVTAGVAGCLETVPTGDVRWRFSTGSAAVSGPVRHGDRVVNAAGNGTVAAVSVATGAQHWSASPASEPLSRPLIGQEMAFVGGDDGRVYALSVSSGEVLWSVETGGAVKGTLAILRPGSGTPPTVIAGSHDHRVYGIDAPSGAKRWTFETDGKISKPPATRGDTVYVSSTDGVLYALRGATGERQWAFDAEEASISTPMVVQEHVVVYAPDDAIVALGADAGETVWRAPADGYVIGPEVAVVGGTLYWQPADAVIQATDPETGDTRWRFDTRSFNAAVSPVVADGTVYVGAFNGDAEFDPKTAWFALDAATGKERWKTETDGLTRGIATDGGNLLTTSGVAVDVLERATGDRRWTYETDDLVSAPLPVPGGVVVASSDGHLYAVESPR
jgi:outer membrane protein assembly factor BamB